MATVAIIWQSCGPYHLARLGGARAVLDSENWKVAGLEVATHDHYRWKEQWSARAGEVETLFEGRAYEALSGREIGEAVEVRLSSIAPKAVAINGWARPEAVAALRWCRRNGAAPVMMAETHVASGNPIKEWVKRRRLRGVRAALVGGRWQANYLAQLGVPREGIAVGYDVVDNEHFRKGADEARKRETKVRKELGLPARFLFACGRFIERKNVAGLISAFKNINASDEIELVIAGGDAEGARELGLETESTSRGRVHFCGPVSYADLPSYYGLAMGFVHVAHEEAWGLVVNEAAAAGLPLLVGNRVGAACELVREGETGWLVESASEAGVRAGLEKLAGLSDQERESMGAAAQKLVAGFGPRQFGQGLLECLGRVAHS